VKLFIFVLKGLLYLDSSCFVDEVTTALITELMLHADKTGEKLMLSLIMLKG